MNTKSPHYNNLLTSLMLAMSAPTEEEAQEGLAAVNVFSKYFSADEIDLAKREASARLETNDYPRQSGWGGLRANTGLNKIEGGKSYEAKLAPVHIQIAEKLGDGNVSEGIRIALDKIIKIRKIG